MPTPPNEAMRRAHSVFVGGRRQGDYTEAVHAPLPEPDHERGKIRRRIEELRERAELVESIRDDWE